MKLSEFGNNFLTLALRINKHNKSYIDFYFGPKKIREIVDGESVRTPERLLTDCEDLLKELFVQRYDKCREKYLEKLFLAMKTSIELLNKIEIPIKQQFLRFYDMALEPVDESKLQKIKEKIENAYGGSGSLEDRMEKLRLRRTIPSVDVFVKFNEAIKNVEMRTKEKFDDLLPNKEKILINLVRDENNNRIKWAYYNWYLGNYQSRIDVNPNFNMYWTTFLAAAAHEAYPGHHTEFVVKEMKLYHELGQFEHSLLLLNTPKLVISEGIAELAVNMLFSYFEQAEIGLNNFCPDPSKEDSVDILTMQNEVKGEIHLFWHNIAYHALFDNWNEKELFKYATSFEIFSEKDIKNQLKKIHDPVHSSTIFSYNLGRNLIINKYGDYPSVKDFKNLLINPVLPSDLL